MRENKCRWQQSISSLNELPKKSFEMAAIRAKQGSTQITIDVCIYTCMCTFKINLFFSCYLFNYIIKKRF